MNMNVSIHDALREFATAVTAKTTQLTAGEPEDQLRGPFENFMAGVAGVLGWKVVCTGETPLPDRLGRPDCAVHLNELLAGYVELKAPGVGASGKRFKGHNREQFKRFSAIPNILYSDGNEWALYRDGELVDKVVRCQVRLIDDLLVNRLNRPLGFVDPGVLTLDPAIGTGTYLLGVIEHALGRVQAEQGEGAVAGQATVLAENLYGFELMVGPYAVSELRVSRALRDRGAESPTDGARVYLTDTLESPSVEPLQLPLFLRPIADQHVKALKVKSNVPVIVCLGNPPYDRHKAATKDNKASTGGWVRWGDGEKGEDAIFRDFVEPVVQAGHGVHLKWLYNQYVYFWRWALWKVFENETAGGPGVVSFISASSYLFGDAFRGMREQMPVTFRRVGGRWLLDL